MNDIFRVENLSNELNEKQLEAVKETEGYVRVVAGPGTGKTRVLTYRYAYISNYLGISTDHILCVTFTNKAASEMKKRIRSLCGGAEGGWVGTFHSICKKILSYDINLLNYPDTFKVIDPADQETILRDIYQTNGFSMKDITFSKALEGIERWKGIHIEYVSTLTAPKYVSDYNGLNGENPLQIIIKSYLDCQRKNYYLDFSDLILFVLYLLDTNKEFCQKWQKQFEYIQVDEFQDVSNKGTGLVYALSEYHKNLFVVGDPDQSIYSFRGADPKRIIDFENIFPNVKTIVLDINYRSTQNILDLADSIIKHNPNRIEKHLLSSSPTISEAQVNFADFRMDEIRWITGEISKLINAGTDLSQIAVLYRANRNSRMIENALTGAKIRYTLYSGCPFYQREEIKDVLAYLQMLISDDELSFWRTLKRPTRGIGDKKAKLIREVGALYNLSDYEALKVLSSREPFNSKPILQYISSIEQGRSNLNNKTIFELMSDLLKDSGYEEYRMTEGSQERLDNLAELKDAIYEFERAQNGEATSLQEYLNNVTLLTNGDIGKKEPSINLMTAHSSKGLEFEYVFVIMLNEGFFPSYKCFKKEDMEEERRLAYVAITRAKKGLFLSLSKKQEANENGMYTPSRFILEIEPNLALFKGNSLDDYRQEYERLFGLTEYIESPQLRVYDIVRHHLFGDGIVLEVADDYFRVQFSEGVSRTFVLHPFPGALRVLALSDEEISELAEKINANK